VTRIFRSSAAEFGQKVVVNGAKAYIGNTEILWAAPRPYGHHFATVIQNEIINLLRGYDVESVVLAAQNEWELVSQYFQIQSDLPNHIDYAEKAHLNSKYHVFCGDGSAKFSQVINFK
jgi:hypothetical protein